MAPSKLQQDKRALGSHLMNNRRLMNTKTALPALQSQVDRARPSVVAVGVMRGHGHGDEIDLKTGLSTLTLLP